MDWTSTALLFSRKVQRLLVGTPFGAVFPPRRPPHNPAVDGRTHALRALRDYVNEIVFQILQTPGPPKPFRLEHSAKQPRFHIGWEDWAQELLLPSIVCVPTQPAEYLPIGLTPQTIEQSRDVHGPGTVLVVSYEYQERFAMEVWASTKTQHRALLAGLEAMLEPTEERAGILLRMPGFYGETVRFTPVGRQIFDDADSSRRRRKTDLTLDMQFNLVRLVNYVEVRPSVSATVLPAGATALDSLAETYTPLIQPPVPGFIAWLNPSLGGALTNLGSIGGYWAPGTSAQVPDQGASPTFDPNAFGTGRPGFQFQIANKDTLKLDVPSGVLASLTVQPITVVCVASAATPNSAVGLAVTIGTAAGGNVNPGITLASVPGPFCVPSSDTSHYAWAYVYFDDTGAQSSGDQETGAPHTGGGSQVLSCVSSAAGTSLYVNGALIETTATPTGGFHVNQIVIGADTDSASIAFGDTQDFFGPIGHVFIYPRALSTAELQTMVTWLTTLVP